MSLLDDPLPPAVHDDSIHPDYINNLNADCLGKIFQFLPLLNKFRIQAVCKRWNELSDLAWENTRSLDIVRQLPRKAWTKESVEKILEKCGHHLKRLTLDGFSRILPSVIAEYCPNLVDLQMDCNCQDWRIKAFFPKLQSFKTYGIAMSRFDGVPDGVFQALPQDELLEIDVEIIWMFPVHLLPRDLSIFSKFTNLSVIKLKNFILDPAFLKTIWKMTKLKTLELVSSWTKNRFPSFKSLTNLENLVLHVEPHIDDAILLEISENCRGLKTLSFRSSCVTYRGVSSLGSLSKLEKLEVSDEGAVISDASLSKLRSLKELCCKGCRGVRDDGIISLIRQAVNLERVNVAYTGITPRLLDEANEIVKQRSNNIELLLVVDELISNHWVVDEEWPLLKVKHDSTVDDDAER